MLRVLLAILIDQLGLKVTGIDHLTHTVFVDGGEDARCNGARRYIKRSLKSVAAEGCEPVVIELPKAHANVIVEAFGGWEVIASIK